MKISTLALTLAFGALISMGAACSSKKTVTETSQEPTPVVTSTEETTDVTIIPPAPTSERVASLGASSSGRSR